MDNNAAEQSIRGFCIGKKNWVMIDTVAGAKSSAIIVDCQVHQNTVFAASNADKTVGADDVRLKFFDPVSRPRQWE